VAFELVVRRIMRRLAMNSTDLPWFITNAILWMGWSMTTWFDPLSSLTLIFNPCSAHRRLSLVSKPRANNGWAFRAFFGFFRSV